LILTNENYYSQEANREYFSVSQLKTFMDCEERAVAELDGMYERPLTTSLLVGSYVDAHFSRELDLFKAKNPQIFTKQGTLKSEFRQAEEIIARIERDRLAMALLSGKTQQIFTGEIFGEPFKVKLDVFLDHEQVEDIVDQFPLLDCLFFSHGAIVDMKIMKDFAPIYKEGAGRQNFIESWQYDLQGAIYQEIVRQNLVLQRGNQRKCHGKVRRRFLQTQTADDIEVSIVCREPQTEPLFQHRKDHLQTVVINTG